LLLPEGTFERSPEATGDPSVVLEQPAASSAAPTSASAAR
jgi:hypothetical protein